MSCERFERDLALYVEGDLPQPEAARLKEHLAGCQRCRAFEREIAASQATLKSLSDDPIPEAALLATRRRVLDAIAQPVAVRCSLVRWRWALATAAVVVAILALTSRLPHAPRPSPTVGATPASPPAAPQTAQRSTPPRPATVSPGAVPTAGARPAVRIVGATHASPLPPEDVDQLVRALVAVSKIKTLADVERGDAEADAPATPLTRVASDDPTVVIYWQFDTNGG